MLGNVKIWRKRDYLLEKILQNEARRRYGPKTNSKPRTCHTKIDSINHNSKKRFPWTNN